MKEWLDQRKDIFEYIAPQAASICFARHNLRMSSIQLVEQLLKEKSVLLIPGEYFGMPGYLRIGFGHSVDTLKTGLARIDDVLRIEDI